MSNLGKTTVGVKHELKQVWDEFAARCSGIFFSDEEVFSTTYNAIKNTALIVINYCLDHERLRDADKYLELLKTYINSFIAIRTDSKSSIESSEKAMTQLNQKILDETKAIMQEIKEEKDAKLIEDLNFYAKLSQTKKS